MPIVERGGALPFIELSTSRADAIVFRHGAHVTHWKPAHVAQGVLWMSSRTHLRGDAAIRGGVPICLPWFGAHRANAAAPSHGFARLVDWTLADAHEAADG